VKPEDIFRGINDTTSAAIKAGQLIASGRKSVGGTTCGMHTTELIIKHATGLKERKRGGVVIDKFEASVDLRKKIWSMASKIMDKKSKLRFDEYNKRCVEMFGCMALRLELPNDTRVSGLYRLFISFLRARNLICVAATTCGSFKQVVEEFVLTIHEWQVLAEFEAILRNMNALAMTSQRDEPGWIAFTWFEVTLTKAKLFSNNAFFKVFDTSQMWSPRAKTEDIPTITSRQHALHEESKELLRRIKKEFDTYFPQPDSDQVIAMNVHPGMIEFVIKFAVSFLFIFGDSI